MLIALIAAWNEARRITPIIEGALQHVPVLVVDDGSTDHTSAAVQATGATLIRHPQNRGKGEALKTGFAWALEHDVGAVVTLDADGQHDPREIPLFLDAHANRAGDLIIGRRNWRRMPFPRRYTNPFGSWILSQVLGVEIHDSQSGYRLYTRRLLNTVDLTSHGFELETEVIIQAALRGLPIGWVDIQTLYGVGEISYFDPLRDTFGFFRMVAHALRERRRPDDHWGQL